MVKPARLHTFRTSTNYWRTSTPNRNGRLYAKEDALREEFKAELISLYGLEEASVASSSTLSKIAVYEYDNELVQSISILTSIGDSRLGESSDV